VLAEPAWNAAQTRTLFFRACGDCHSNQTTWPPGISRWQAITVSE